MNYKNIISLIQVIIPMIAVFSFLVSIVSIAINSSIHKKNRSVNTVIQLNKDFYQNHDFTEHRLKLWATFNELKNTDFKWDFIAIIQSIKNNDGKLTVGEIVALNRTAAFYNNIVQLIKENEINIEILRNFLSTIIIISGNL